MKISELWLRERVNTSLDSETLLNQITMAGLEVNNVYPVANVFHGVVIGKIVECCTHPNISKLWITKVNIGDKHLLEIFSSAPNCRLGLKVAVANIDAVLSGNFKVKPTEWRSQPSEGMLCSYSELGISEYYSGIIELPVDAPIGIDIRDYLKLDDNTIEIGVTPNRGDCLSIIGIARDVAALNKTELNILKITPVIDTVSDSVPILVEDIDACPRYLARVVKGINVKALTPLWMKEKLRRCGMRSVDAVTDIANYVLLELGLPIHAFDKDRIDGGIVVRMAKRGEAIALLDGSKLKLNSDTLVVADYNKALAICGIHSGKHSSIHNETKNVLLECAFFNPLFIIGRAHRYDLHTDVSYRYERGVDPELQHKAMELVTRLMIDICGGKTGPVIDVTSEVTLPKRATITLRRNKLDLLIGYHINDVQISDILRRLGCSVIKDENLDQWEVVTPSWRFDIKIEEDLVEEIVRIYGYDNIPNKPVLADLVMISHRETETSLKRVKTLLSDKGYLEVITYSFVDPKIQLLIHPGKKALILSNPISREMSTMRLSLQTGLLRTIVYNLSRQQKRVRIFETGFRFIPDAQASLGIRLDMMLAGAICGDRYEEHWSLAKIGADFYDIKGDLESVLDLTGKLSEIRFCAEVIPALHPGLSAAIYMKKERIGFIGVIHPDLERKLHLSSRTMLFELEWEKFPDRVIPRALEVSRFPTNRRDIAIVVSENIPAADILSECKKVSVNLVVSVNLFDVYCRKDISKGFKSLAISLILQDTSRTLEEEEIAAIVAKCVKALKERFQASLRD